MNRSIQLIFIASLLLNLLLAGVIIGHVWWHMSGPWAEMTDAATPGLPADKKAMITGVMKKIHANTEDLHHQIMASHDRAMQLLKATPFDKAAYLAEVQHGQDLHAQIGKTVTTNLADTAASMSPKDRALLADALQRMPFGGGSPGPRRPPRKD